MSEKAREALKQRRIEKDQLRTFSVQLAAPHAADSDDVKGDTDDDEGADNDGAEVD